MPINFPKTVGKESEEAIFTSYDAVSMVQKERLKQMPKKALIVLSESSERKLVDMLSLRKYTLPFNSAFFHYITPSVHIDNDNTYLLVKITIGAPVIAIMAEDLATAGVKSFLLMGTAGGVGKGLSIGDISLCTKALRDEGTSYHYLKDSLFVEADKRLTLRLAGQMKKENLSFRIGRTWTTDALYRETRAEINKYSSIGILTVEMEAAALFAVAKKREVPAAGIFVVSDLINGQKWTGMKEHALDEGFGKLARVAKIYSCLGI